MEQLTYCCTLSKNTEYCTSCSLKKYGGCKIIGDFFSAAKKNCLDLLDIEDSEKEELLTCMAKKSLEIAVKKQKQSFTRKDVINFCSEAEDNVLIYSFQLYPEQKKIMNIRILFEYLCKKYFHYICKIASAKLPNHSYCTSNEIFQRVMIKLMAKQFAALFRFEGRSSFKTFLTTLIYRSISDCLRQEYRQKKMIDETDEMDGKEMSDSQNTSFNQENETQLFTEIVIDVIKEINEFWNLKDVQMLFWRLQGMPIKEIASILNIKENTVSQKLTRKGGLIERFALMFQGRLRRLYGLDIHDFDIDEIKNRDFWFQIMSLLPDNVRLKE